MYNKLLVEIFLFRPFNGWSFFLDFPEFTLDFRQVFAIFQVFLYKVFFTELGFEFLIKFYTDYRGLDIFQIHSHFSVVEGAQNLKI